MPTSEKKGRRHSSDITLVWLDEEKRKSFTVKPEDVREEFIKTSGPGGQNKNKRETAVRLTHLPSGLQVVADGQRTQGQNRATAWARLQEKLTATLAEEAQGSTNAKRSDVFGGARAWIWTEWRDSVTGPEGQRGSHLKALRGNLRQLLKR